MRPFHGDVAGLTSLRLRPLLCFLRRWDLSDTAHALEQETGVSFMPEYLRLLLAQDKWAEAEAYVASRLASLVLTRIRIFGVMSKFAVGEASTVPAASFRRAEAGLLAHPELHAVRRVLDSMRSDPDKASRLYAHIHPGAVEAIMKWVAKCPELKSKNRAPPRCPFDRPTEISVLKVFNLNKWSKVLHECPTEISVLKVFNLNKWSKVLHECSGNAEAGV
ncbi:uncharacterized protein [Triticum aestivum]|uniref:uncharacterized protein n=1 Tax=Triticum aestivum TaxID=4565 RepID=UPI001D02E05D|nr:uncharacterized protein LOC123101250 [Triticum aestivum]